MDMSLPRGELMITSGNNRVATIPPGASNQVLVIDTSNEDKLVYKNTYKKYFSAYDAGGGINLNGGFTGITWDTEDYKDTDYYSHSADGSQVTILQSATYIISVDISTSTALSLTQSISTVRLELNTGSGFSAVSGTIAPINLGTIASGSGSAHIVKIAALSAGSILQVTAERTTGTGTVTTVANGCRIIIETA
jgi:hypothetical protein